MIFYIERKKYPDGSIYAELINELSENESGIKFRAYNKEFLVASFSIRNYEDLFFLASAIDVLRHNLSSNLKIGICFNFVLSQQHDRRFDKNQSFELKNVCNFINSLKIDAVGVFSPHSDVLCALLDNYTDGYDKDIFSRFFDKVLENIASSEKENLVIVTPDAGAYKRFFRYFPNFDKYPVVSANKYRGIDGKPNVSLDLSQFQWKNYLIIDDICVNGGTFIELFKEIYKYTDDDYNTINLAVCNFSHENPSKELEQFSRIFTTNGNVQNVNLDNIKILKIEEL